MIGSHESLKERVVLKVIFMWRDIDVQSVKLYIDFSQSVYIHISNTTERIGIMKAYYSERMDMIWRAAEKAEPELAQYIVRGVTEGLSYDLIKVKMDIPCCKDVYYSAYRRFFWILSKERD